MALDTDTGNLYAWGHNGNGQVGNGELLDSVTPAVVLTGVTSMSAGDGFSLAIKTDQSAWAWGRNTHGQLGLGDTADRVSPAQIPGVGAATEIAAGGQHTLILLTNGSILAAGNNSFGQLGLGTTTSTSTPTAVPGLIGITQISAGYFHSVVRGAGNQIFVWGRNFEGQCGGGSGSPVTYLSPQTLSGLPSAPIKVACGYHFTLFEFADGSVSGSGSNSDGQLDGTSVADQDDSKKVLTLQAVPLSPDDNAPSPDPMSFASPPAAFDATTIMMAATTASDSLWSGGILLQCLTSGGNNSGWQTETAYEDTGLTTEFVSDGLRRAYAARQVRPSPGRFRDSDGGRRCLRHRNRDLQVGPDGAGVRAITITATTAADANGVEYFFEVAPAAGHDSGWQDSATYVDSGLCSGRLGRLIASGPATRA